MPKWPKQSGETAPEDRLSRVDTTPVNSGLRKAKSFEDWADICTSRGPTAQTSR